jgi:hypothetical protein
MSHQKAVSQWEQTVSRQMPHLSTPQAKVLAWWSYGMIVAKSCGITSVVTQLAVVLGQKEDALRQRLREWCYAAADKQGPQRTEVQVSGCFAPLLRWVLAWWSPAERRLALALDATTLGARFVVLTISVVYRGCGIPVAWVVVPAGKKGAWRPHWEELLRSLKGVVPAEWQVIVLADRGLYAPWLFEAIVAVGWQPFLRINVGGMARRQAGGGWGPLTRFAPTPGRCWSGKVVCFKERSLRCTLLAAWTPGYRDAWLVVTTVPPEVAEVAWYGMRPWIEASFKDTKRGGWQWQQTRMSDPGRASRLWLAMAVAMLWVLSVGGEADASLPASSLEALPERQVARRLLRRGSRPRLVSCFARGIALIVGTLLTGQPLPLGQFLPEPWPAHLPHDALGEDCV